MSGWDSAWNKPEDELSDAEKAARQQYLENQTWLARTARQKKAAGTGSFGSAPGYAVRTPRPQPSEPAPRQNMTNAPRSPGDSLGPYVVAVVVLVLSFFSILLGKSKSEVDPMSMAGSGMMLLGFIGLVIAIVLAIAHTIKPFDQWFKDDS